MLSLVRCIFYEVETDKHHQEHHIQEQTNEYVKAYVNLFLRLEMEPNNFYQGICNQVEYLIVNNDEYTQ